MMPVDAYRCYLSLKNHFTKDSYDYHKYCGKSRATVQSFYKRKDRFWFEKVSRQKTDQEIVEFFVSNFVACTDPSKLWIGEMMRDGEDRYESWKKRNQSLSYVFKEETQSLFEDQKVDEVFDCSKGHPPILKNFLSGKISPETMVICDKIFLFGKDFDRKLQDPVWETVSRRLKKYSSFLNIDVPRYKNILKEIILKGK
jgi:hypothetical protein